MTNDPKLNVSRFALAEPGIRVAPSLLSADFARLETDVAKVESAGATVLHLDVMDGHFVPNISFGAPVIAALRKHTRMIFDAHLMISDPKKYASIFAKSGCDHITFHIEVTTNPDETIDEIRNTGASVGVALNPTTPVHSIESILEKVDMVLVMSVWPGFSGQAFMHEVLPKVRELRSRLRSDQRLEIDGGVDKKTIALAAEAGADTFVAGTAVFGAADCQTAFRELQTLAAGPLGPSDDGLRGC